MEGFVEAREIEGHIRRRMAKMITISAIVMTLCDIGFFVIDYRLGEIQGSVFLFFLGHIMLPMLLNISLLTFMWCIEYGRYTAGWKTGAVAFSINSICGVAAIFHANYLVLWLAPGFGMLFLAISHNNVLKRLLLVYSYVLVGIAYLCLIWHADRFTTLGEAQNGPFLFQNLILAFLVLTMFYGFSRVLHAHIEEMLEYAGNLLKQSDEYQERVSRDPLTGCYSRDYLSHNIEKIFRKCSNRLATTLALIDIDDFKKVNDTYGHDCGDQVLERIGKLGRTLGHAESERPAYRICRYGGEEFLFIFSDRNPVTCQKQIEEFRRVFESQEYDFTDSRITLSGGVVTCSSPQEFNTVFKAVDEALYHAKATGKNKIIVGKGI